MPVDNAVSLWTRFWTALRFQAFFRVVNYQFSNMRIDNLQL